MCFLGLSRHLTLARGKHRSCVLLLPQLPALQSSQGLHVYTQSHMNRVWASALPSHRETCPCLWLQTSGQGSWLGFHP